jgi:hypothetical protein
VLASERECRCVSEFVSVGCRGTASGLGAYEPGFGSAKGGVSRRASWVVWV